MENKQIFNSKTSPVNGEVFFTLEVAQLVERRFGNTEGQQFDSVLPN